MVKKDNNRENLKATERLEVAKNGEEIAEPGFTPERVKNFEVALLKRIIY